MAEAAAKNGAAVGAVARRIDVADGHRVDVPRIAIAGSNCQVWPARDFCGAPSSILGFIHVGGRRYFVVPDDLASAVNGVAGAGLASPDVAERGETPAELLTSREMQIAELIAAGRCNKDIARSLGVSVWTVATHLRRIFSKLNVRSRTELAARVIVAQVARQPHVNGHANGSGRPSRGGGGRLS